MESKNLSHRVFHSPHYFIAFGFGSGLSPIAPGTCGTLAAMPIYLLLSYLSWPLYVLWLVAAFAIGVWVSDQVSRELKVHDFSGIVWDECLGYWMTMFLAPVGWIWMLYGFILFRVFDIWKPLWIGKADKYVKGGLGIMLDDVLAAIPAWVVLHIIAWGSS
ncbi:MAG: phosphatidylglycerophosphatase A [Methylococcales bacterium]|nr:phosphatidylglycerophosphatase A [Methylococcales bacterium]